MKNSVHFMSEKMDWETPQWLFYELDKEFDFNIDVCATNKNTKCDYWFTEHDDALSVSWSDYLSSPVICWMNPPYGREIKHWIRKASTEAEKSCTVVCLIPYRPDTQYWFDYIWEPTPFGSTWYARKPREGVEVRALKGRLKFGNAENSAPFPSAIVIFRGTE